MHEKMPWKIVLMLTILSIFLSRHSMVQGETKLQFFYQKKTGMLMIDGSVKGKSDPITLDMKANRFNCVIRQYFVFTFCPDLRKLKARQFCNDGIAFCYEPILVEEYAKPHFQLKTNPDLEISKRCGELFRGFKVSMKQMYTMNFNKRLFYEIQTGYESEPYYFAKPSSNCIAIWLGNEHDLGVIVRNEEDEEIFPVQVREIRSSKIVGALNHTFNTAGYPEPSKNARFEESFNLGMLYLDFKSREFTPQMMFTVGPDTVCNLYAQIRSNNVGKCSASFKQKTVALRPYGHNTTSFYTLTLESGVETNETRGSKSQMQKILDKEYSTTTMEEESETNTDPSIQSYEESVQGGEEKVLEHVTKPPVEETKDITSWEKKAAAAAINTAAAIGCGLFSVVTAGFGSCSAKVEFKDIQTTTFNEAYTKSSINTQKQQKSSSSVHSVQQVLQTAFTHTKGSTDSTTKSEQRSMSNAVTKRTVFLYEIEVPNDKILTPMQMAVNCDNSRVSIPWIKFRLTDIDEGFSDDYGEEEENFDIDEDEAPSKNANNKNEDDYPDLDEYDDLRRQSQQEKDADSAFNQESTNNDDDDVYDEFEFDEEEEKNEESKPTNTDKYSYYDAKKMLLKIFIFGCFMFLILEQIFAVFSGIEKGTQFTKEPKVVVHKHFYYDKFGNLVLNGSVPGNSSALTIDFKKYYPTCYTNVYFNFIFYFAPDAVGEICEEGMTICYEGQLFGEHVKPEYSVPNLNINGSHTKEYFEKCQNGTSSKSTSLRGLNIAIKTFKGLADNDIKSEAKNFVLPKKRPNGNDWRFFVISSSFFEQKYYFIMPEDNAAVLQIGQGKTMEVRVTDTIGVELPLVTFAIKGKEFGTKTLGGPAPDLNNGKKLAKFVGLWLLYMDFKTDYTQWQTISVVNPPQNSKCQLMLEIRGNRMRPCRSYFEDIAVLEPVDANVKMVYTSEVGTVRHQDYGQEDAKATSTRWQKEQLRQSTTIDSTDSKDSFKDINEDTMKEITEKEKRVQTDHIHKYEAEVSLNANPEKAQRDQVAGNVGQGKQSGFNARVGVGGSYQNTESEYKSTKDTNERTNIKIDTSNQFNNIKKSTAMMESFKSTSGASELMEQSEFLQTTSAFTTRELVDIRISIPRNKKVIIKQLFFDCDGNIVKMPFILYTDGKERLKLQEQNASPKIKRPLSPNWANETSEDNLPKRKSMNVVSAPIEQNDDFDEFMNEFED